MPDTISLSSEAVALLRHLLATKDTGVTPGNLEVYRELVKAGIMFPMSGMTTGPESRFLFTEDGWRGSRVGPSAVAPWHRNRPPVR